METTNAMTVNENGNVNVESLKIVIIWKSNRKLKQELFQKMKYWKTLAKS